MRLMLTSVMVGMFITLRGLGASMDTILIVLLVSILSELIFKDK